MWHLGPWSSCGVRSQLDFVISEIFSSLIDSVILSCAGPGAAWDGLSAPLRVSCASQHCPAHPGGTGTAGLCISLFSQPLCMAPTSYTAQSSAGDGPEHQENRPGSHSRQELPWPWLPGESVAKPRAQCWIQKPRISWSFSLPPQWGQLALPRQNIGSSATPERDLQI